MVAVELEDAVVAHEEQHVFAYLELDDVVARELGCQLQAEVTLGVERLIVFDGDVADDVAELVEPGYEHALDAVPDGRLGLERRKDIFGAFVHGG